MLTRHPCWIASRPVETGAWLPVTDKTTGEVVAQVALADATHIDTAIAAAVAATGPMRAMRPYQRKAVLEHCVARFRARFDELAEALCVEAGKPIVFARGEVSRLIDTFVVAAEESVRIGGELIDLEISPASHGRSGMIKRVPIGPCSFITPFNFPLNLVAHKVAPAIAAGCPFVLKPASRTPLGALIIGEILAETELPPGAFSILPCPREGAELFTTDPRIKLLSFTGSQDVGWALKAKAGKKRVSLELGGNAACILHHDWPDLDGAVQRICIGAFYQSGQSCIGVQRILIHASIYEEVKRKLVAAAGELVVGPPRDEGTFLGPMISEGEAIRVAAWVEAAVAAGGTLLCGGTREGHTMAATLLEGVPRHVDLVAKEVFGPVAVLSPYSDFDAALAEVNDSRYGLQAGVFTRDLYLSMRAWDVLEVGGVVIGDIPSWRVDHMPYGGVKDSGFGREGIRWSIQEMTEERLLVIRDPSA
jgi:acyl-CoA reductase-like NAD-dependent aldehyde dehydrogenase